MKSRHTNARFPKTRWTLVLRAGDNGDPERTRVLNELYRIYWPPVYAYIRSRGRSPEDAEDLTQGFFSDLSRRDLEHVSPGKGRMRTFLLTSVKNYLHNDHRNHHRQKRGGSVDFLPLSDALESHYAPELANTLTPDQVYERHWLMALLESVLHELEEKYRAGKKSDLFEALRPFLAASASEALPSHREVAEKLGLRENTVNVAVHRLRRQYGKLVREHIADTLEEGEDVEEEMRYLMGVFE